MYCFGFLGLVSSSLGSAYRSSDAFSWVFLIPVMHVMYMSYKLIKLEGGG
jgi:hypothetical protein